MLFVNVYMSGFYDDLNVAHMPLVLYYRYSHL